MMSPQMMEMMKSMDFNQEKVTAQFQELGLKPEDVISKVSLPQMADISLLCGSLPLSSHAGGCSSGVLPFGDPPLRVHSPHPCQT